MIVSRDQQIRSLLDGTACELVEKYVPADRTDAEAYAEVFTVNRNEIMTYLRTHYQLEDVVHTCPGSDDGFYVFPITDGYSTFVQERQFKTEEILVKNIKEAWEEFIDYLIATSGTGLKFG